MKILLIQSYLGRRERPVFPLGLSYLGGSLKGHEVSIIDPNVEEDPFGSIRKRLSDFKPDVTGISLRNIDTTIFKDKFLYYKTLGPTVDLIREVSPHSFVIIGGAAFSLFAEEIMVRNPKIDFGVYLEGEETLVELIENLTSPFAVKGVYYRKDGKVIFSGPRQLSDFELTPAPNRDLLEFGKYSHPEGTGVQSKRGCCLNCAYCTYPFLTGNRLRLRSPQKVVDEIEALTQKRGLTHYMFADTVFNMPKQHAVEICEELIRRGVTAKWGAYFSLKGIDEDFIRLAHRAGCNQFLFSPDGYSDRSLAALRKEIDKKVVIKVYRLSSKLKLREARFDFSFFMNAPGQTYASFFAVIWLLLKTNFILPRRKFMHIYLNVARIEPHTELYKLAVKEGTVSVETKLLPLDEQNLSLLFYHNKEVGFAEGIYRMLVKIKDIIKTASVPEAKSRASV